MSRSGSHKEYPADTGGCEFLVGWNKHSAVPAEDMSITIRMGGTALCLFQPAADELKNSQTQSGCELLVGWNKRRWSR